MKKLTSKLLAGFSALGLLSMQSAEAQSFRSEAEARAYLTQNPTGPRAEEAFRRIIQGTIADRYPEFSRSALSDGFASSVPSGSAAGNAISQLASGSGVPAANTGGSPAQPQSRPPSSGRPNNRDDNEGTY